MIYFCTYFVDLQFPITAIREIKILKKLHHENVIDLKEIVTSPGTLLKSVFSSYFNLLICSAHWHRRVYFIQVQKGMNRGGQASVLINFRFYLSLLNAWSQKEFMQWFAYFYRTGQSNLHELVYCLILTDGNKYKGGIYMVFEYMDHDLTGLADRPGMRFTVPQIKVNKFQRLLCLYFYFLSLTLVIILRPSVLYEAALDGASLLSCQSSSSPRYQRFDSTKCLILAVGVVTCVF